MRRGACGATWIIGWSRNSKEVTTPKFPPPPMYRPKEIGILFAVRCHKRPSARTISTARRLSNRQAAPAGQISDTSAEGEPGPPVLEMKPGRRGHAGGVGSRSTWSTSAPRSGRLKGPRASSALIETSSSRRPRISAFFLFLVVRPAPMFPKHLHIKKGCGVVWCCTESAERWKHLSSRCER